MLSGPRGGEMIYQNINSALQCDLISAEITVLTLSQSDSQGEDVSDRCHNCAAILEKPMQQ